MSDLVNELRSLRRGRGVTLDKLSRCTAVLDALGTRDALEATKRLTERLESLGDGTKARALKAALGLYGVKYDTLTERRGAMVTETDRSADTLENWENEMIEELATLLRSVGKSARSGIVNVTAMIHQRVQKFIVYTWEPYPGATDPAPQIFRNLDTTAPSMSALIWRFTENLNAARLELSVAFAEDSTPAQVWAASSGTATGLVWGANRTEVERRPPDARIELPAATTHWDNPEQGVLYCISWLY